MRTLRRAPSTCLRPDLRTDKEPLGGESLGLALHKDGGGEVEFRLAGTGKSNRTGQQNTVGLEPFEKLHRFSIFDPIPPLD